MYTVKDNINETGTISLKQLFMIIWERKLLLLSIIFVSVTISIIVSKVQAPYYRAWSTILPNEKNSKSSLSSQMSNVAAVFGISNVSGEVDPAIIYNDIIKSRTFLISVCSLKYKSQTFVDSQSIASITKSTESKFDGIIDRVRNSINVLLDGKTGVTTVTVEEIDPVYTAELANVIVKNLDEYLRNYKFTKHNKDLEFLEKNLKISQIELQIASNKLLEFRKNNVTFNGLTSPNLSNEMEWLMREVRIQEEKYLLIKKEFEMAKIEQEKDKPNINVLDKAIPPKFRFKPRIKNNVLVAFGTSLILGAVLCFLLGEKQRKKNA